MTRVWLPIDCLLCGEPPLELCAECHASLPLREHSISRLSELTGLAVADYQGEVSALIRAFKGSGSKTLQRLIGLQMARTLSRVLDDLGVHSQRAIWFIPAPSSARNFRGRGFAPAQLLASAVRNELLLHGRYNVRVANMLRVVGATVDQAGLGKLERSRNLEGKFVVNIKRLEALRKALPVGSSNPFVVLLDDIVTTGATMSEMQTCLARSGLQASFFLTFAETL